MSGKNPKGINFTDRTLKLVATSKRKKKDKSFSKAVNRIVIEHLTSCNKSKANTLDTEILEKLIPVFVSKRLKVKLEPEEIDRIKELFKNG